MPLSCLPHLYDLKLVSFVMYGTPNVKLSGGHLLSVTVHPVFGVLGSRCLLDCHVLKGFGIYMIEILDRLY